MYLVSRTAVYCGSNIDKQASIHYERVSETKSMKTLDISRTIQPPEQARLIGLWLLAICAMVFAMVVLGGFTRLTESGLSMTGWRPVTGWFPPLSVEEWQAHFDAYRSSPEYQKINAGMSLDEYKEIFWLEYLHRLWGRFIGIAFAVPFAFFLIKGWLSRPMIIRLSVLFALGGLQGVIGWWMVKSGLVDRPDVSQYRLAVHLLMAFLIIGLALWNALNLLSYKTCVVRPQIQRFSTLIVGVVFVTVFSGALVAGLNAGMIYNTFPLMQGQVFPTEGFAMSPWYKNFFEDLATVQFQHRILAVVSALLVVGLWVRLRKFDTGLGYRANLMLVVVLAQVAMGISTLLLVVPIPLAAAHQAGAVVLLISVIWVRHGLRTS